MGEGLYYSASALKYAVQAHAEQMSKAFRTRAPATSRTFLEAVVPHYNVEHVPQSVEVPPTLLDNTPFMYLPSGIPEPPNERVLDPSVVPMYSPPRVDNTASIFPAPSTLLAAVFGAVFARMAGWGG